MNQPAEIPGLGRRDWHCTNATLAIPCVNVYSARTKRGRVKMLPQSWNRWNWSRFDSQTHQLGWVLLEGKLPPWVASRPSFGAIVLVWCQVSEVSRAAKVGGSVSSDLCRLDQIQTLAPEPVESEHFVASSDLSIWKQATDISHWSTDFSQFTSLVCWWKKPALQSIYYGERMWKQDCFGR